MSVWLFRVLSETPIRSSVPFVLSRHFKGSSILVAHEYCDVRPPSVLLVPGLLIQLLSMF